MTPRKRPKPFVDENKTVPKRQKLNGRPNHRRTRPAYKYSGSAERRQEPMETHPLQQPQALFQPLASSDNSQQAIQRAKENMFLDNKSYTYRPIDQPELSALNKEFHDLFNKLHGNPREQQVFKHPGLYTVTRQVASQLHLPEAPPRHRLQLSWARDQTEVEKLFVIVSKRWTNLALFLSSLTQKEKELLRKDRVLKTMMAKDFLLRYSFWLKSACAVANGSPVAKPGLWNKFKPWTCTNDILKRVAKSQIFHDLYAGASDPLSFINRKGSHNEIVAYGLTRLAQTMAGKWDGPAGMTEAGLRYRQNRIIIDRDFTADEKFLMDGITWCMLSQLSSRMTRGAQEFFNTMGKDTLRLVHTMETNVPRPYVHPVYVRSLNQRQDKTKLGFANSFAYCLGCGVLEGHQPFDMQGKTALEFIRDPTTKCPCFIAWIEVALKLEEEMGSMCPRISKHTGNFKPFTKMTWTRDPESTGRDLWAQTCTFKLRNLVPPESIANVIKNPSLCRKTTLAWSMMSGSSIQQIHKSSLHASQPNAATSSVAVHYSKFQNPTLNQAIYVPRKTYDVISGKLPSVDPLMACNAALAASKTQTRLIRLLLKKQCNTELTDEEKKLINEPEQVGTNRFKFLEEETRSWPTIKSLEADRLNALPPSRPGMDELPPGEAGTLFVPSRPVETPSENACMLDEYVEPAAVQRVEPETGSEEEEDLLDLTVDVELDSPTSTPRSIARPASCCLSMLGTREEEHETPPPTPVTVRPIRLPEKDDPNYTKIRGLDFPAKNRRWFRNSKPRLGVRVQWERFDEASWTKTKSLLTHSQKVSWFASTKPSVQKGIATLTTLTAEVENWTRERWTKELEKLPRNLVKGSELYFKVLCRRMFEDNGWPRQERRGGSGKTSRAKSKTHLVKYINTVSESPIFKCV